ncbi:DUF262 domain-containing protein [Melittangium boletus]|uniref:GmrSD restriction endonucleases N-terminal domain-containing protein n=1 Tax=Melittangium boletus DSM 14713 TaxID=1294270 RepID=A0A250IJH5_9BACT|nr:DUF262 domain-containing protein [Melittangium boletus]ATB31096.1 hypothetical protein MEBOL_004558 [Melittangium boletus DSM 14713]
MKIYDEGAESLHEILRAASSDQGATLLVPDLQRPYVWSPSQVTLLVDSLLRGWPFGTLLLWSVHKEDLAGIPSRPFWRIADRTDEFDDAQVSKSNPPAQFRMVLDGQQRLQSLLLAFGGDSWGFRLLDQEWSMVLDAERPKGKNAKRHWSLGHLSLDVWAFRERVKEVGGVGNVDFRDVLSWVVQSPNDGRSTLSRPANYKHPIASALDAENKGRFVRLSRLWDLASTQPGLFEQHFRQKLKPLLSAHDVPKEIIEDVLVPLAELVVTLVSIKQSKVSYLQLSPFDAEVINQDVYNDAIVNIFTRLNTAGRALTRQEITFAWIKTGWDASKTSNRTAGRCFEDLNEALAAAGVSIDIDALVGLVSAMWSVLHRDGALLTATDLLRGEKVRPMAQDLVKNWDILVANAVEGAQLVQDRGFRFGEHYRSLNVLTLLLAWRLLGRWWLEAHPLSVADRDGFEKSLDVAFKDHCDRWILLSQWSGRWVKSTDKAFAEYTKDLATDWSKLAVLASPDDVIGALKTRMDVWIGALQAESSKYIDDLAVLTRNRVHDYYLPLWLWHRLDAQRWKASALPLRESKRGSPSLDVDHIVAVKLWETLPGAQAQAQADADDESALSADDLSTTMNALGNCCLLEKSFNIAKSAESLRAFLERVHEFKTGQLKVDDWTRELGVDAMLVDPSDKPAVDVRLVVEARTTAMKAELKEYLVGTRQRADV